MTNDEAKAAFREGVPVVAGGIEYAYISALITRRHGGKIIPQVELQDKSGRGVTIAHPEKVTRANLVRLYRGYVGSVERGAWYTDGRLNAIRPKAPMEADNRDKNYVSGVLNMHELMHFWDNEEIDDLHVEFGEFAVLSEFVRHMGFDGKGEYETFDITKARFIRPVGFEEVINASKVFHK